MKKIFQKRVVRTKLYIVDLFLLVDCLDVCKKQTTLIVNGVNTNPHPPPPPPTLILFL